MATATDPLAKYKQVMGNTRLAAGSNPLVSNTVLQAGQTPQIQKTATQSSNPASQQPATTTTPISRTDQTLGSMQDYINQGYAFSGPQAFKYDRDNDPAYQAAIESAQQNITQNRADTNAHLRAGGQGKSSYSEGVANQIGAKEMARVSTDVLPALISQAYQQYADAANRDFAVQQANYGVSQDRIGNMGNLYGLQYQQDVTRPMQEAQLTGSYLSGEARQYIDAINGLKAQAEAPGITAAARSQLSTQADQYRQALQGLGVDSNLFGANVNQATSMANANRAGVQTLDAQQIQYAQSADQRDFDAQQERYAVADQQWQQNYGVTLAQITGYMPDGTPTSDQQQRELANLWTVADQTGTIPPQLASIYGLQAGMPTQAAKQFASQLAIQQQNANTSAYSAAQSAKNAAANTALNRERFAYDQQQDALRASSQSANYSYKTDPSFALAIQRINTNPADALPELQEKAEVIIGAFGYDGYSELLRQAEAKTKNTTNSPYGALLPNYMQR
jgi:hypothetical protein